jgi:prepilin-type N-terminal cleavage/methylation domain-containing protein
MKYDRNRGFTLVEILVAMAILIVLIGIGFSVSGPARESARQRVCVSNLHQLDLAFAMYRQDYDGVEVSAPGTVVRYDQLGLPSGTNALAFARAYVKNDQIFRCPDFHGIGPQFQQAKHVFCTYSWYPNEDGNLGENGFSHLVWLKGGATPVLACNQHYGSLDMNQEPRWVEKKVIVLRLDHKIDVKNVPLRAADVEY